MMTQDETSTATSNSQDWLTAARERVRVFAQYDGAFAEQADVVVVGSGPCGAVAAYELAAAGHDVILLEEGPPFTVRDLELDGNLSMTRTMREGGLRMTRGTIMPTMQAIALGGGWIVTAGKFAFGATVVAHVVEFVVKRSVLERADGSMGHHFVQTLIYGLFHWKPLEDAQAGADES